MEHHHFPSFIPFSSPYPLQIQVSEQTPFPPFPFIPPRQIEEAEPAEKEKGKEETPPSQETDSQDELKNLRELAIDSLKKFGKQHFSFWITTPFDDVAKSQQLLEQLDSLKQKVVSWHQMAVEKSSTQIEKEWGGVEFDKSAWEKKLKSCPHITVQEFEWIAQDPTLSSCYVEKIKLVYQLMLEMIKNNTPIHAQHVGRISKVVELLLKPKEESPGELFVKFDIQGKIFEIPKSVLLNVEGHFKRLLSLPYKEQDGVSLIPLEEIDIPCFEKVVEWLSKRDSSIFKEMEINDLFQFLGQTARFEIPELISDVDVALSKKIDKDNSIPVINALFDDLTQNESDFILPVTLYVALKQLEKAGFSIDSINESKRQKTTVDSFYPKRDAEWAKNFLLDNSFKITLSNKYLPKLKQEENLKFLMSATDLKLNLENISSLTKPAKLALAQKFPSVNQIIIEIVPRKKPIIWDFFDQFPQLRSISILLSTTHSGKKSLKFLKKTFPQDCKVPINFCNHHYFTPVIKYTKKVKTADPTPPDGKKRKRGKSGPFELTIDDFCQILSLNHDKAKIFQPEVYGRDFYSLMTDVHLLDLLKRDKIDLDSETLDLSRGSNLSSQGLSSLFNKMNKLKHLSVGKVSDEIYSNLHLLLNLLPNISILEIPIAGLFQSRGQYNKLKKLKTLKLIVYPDDQKNLKTKLGETFQILTKQFPTRDLELNFKESSDQYATYSAQLSFSKNRCVINLLNSFSNRNLVPTLLSKYYITGIKAMTQTLEPILDLTYLKSFKRLSNNYDYAWASCNPLELISKELSHAKQLTLFVNNELLRENFECLEGMNFKIIDLETDIHFHAFSELILKSSLLEVLKKKRCEVRLKLNGFEGDLKEASQEKKEDVLKNFIEQSKHFIELFNYSFNPFTYPSTINVREMIEDRHLLEFKPKKFQATSLYLNGLSKITDSGLMIFLEGFPSLEEIDITGCASLTPKIIDALKEKYPVTLLKHDFMQDS